ncbi:hypothetical protein HPB50_023893 [Hyalomma asiaticum]|uniref:Uncharacterized protein n=1 Tax=Hyalomma asiaticum TaxID=266040 RepID=A0ACB7TQ66_HYAAI|nr:hypothetical protein HPB50_023893 [Hyalomma asiaticum]
MTGPQTPKTSQQAPQGPTPVIENNVVRSAAPEPPIPHCDFPTCLRKAWKEFADRTALIENNTDERCTYGELEELCYRVVAGLRNLGFGPGDMAGEVCYQFEDTCPCIVFCDESNVNKVAAAQKKIPSIKNLVVFGSHAGAHSFASLRKTPLSECQLPPAAAEPDSLLFVLYSSGTTGKPKGVMISHRNVVAQFTSAGAAPKRPRPSCNIGTAPFAHASGILMVNSIFARGDTLVVSACTDPDVLIPAIAKHKAGNALCPYVSFLLQFPTYLKKMLKSPLLEQYDLSSLMMISLAGSTAPPDLVAEARAKLKVFAVGQGKCFRTRYGLTESFGAGTFSFGVSVSSDCIGAPNFMSSLKASKQLQSSDSIRGEIRIKSPCCAMGYLNNSQATAELYDEEGFLKTGDMGYYSDQGLFYITDRMKDLIKCMEQQVPPAELEALLLQHGAVHDVAVVGVPHDEYGEAARAFVVLKEGHEPSDTLKDALFSTVAGTAY